ncbi:unnamed protein product [Clavelina lepadiformis]|uniref:Uncharacterized protein n=1 Tax=Clavelina lepadiformis TaxID=159417 RepID=A0ABP0FRQ1_CLALP
MDMLKFHKYTIGHAWTTDFGSSDNKEQFQWLINYERLHSSFVITALLRHTASSGDWIIEYRLNEVRIIEEAHLDGQQQPGPTHQSGGRNHQWSKSCSGLECAVI